MPSVGCETSRLFRPFWAVLGGWPSLLLVGWSVGRTGPVHADRCRRRGAGPDTLPTDGAVRPVGRDRFTRTAAGDGGAGPDTLPADVAVRPVGQDGFTRTGVGDGGASPDTLPAGGAVRPVGLETRTAAGDRGGCSGKP